MSKSPTWSTSNGSRFINYDGILKADFPAWKFRKAEQETAIILQ